MKYRNIIKDLKYFIIHKGDVRLDFKDKKFEF